MSRNAFRLEALQRLCCQCETTEYVFTSLLKFGKTRINSCFESGSEGIVGEVRRKCCGVWVEKVRRSVAGLVRKEQQGQQTPREYLGKIESGRIILRP